MKKVAIIIPAYNEQKVIKNTIISAISIVGKSNVFVVDDGSKDKTCEVALKYTRNVLTIKNGGKANALNEGISKFRLTKRYEFIMPIDADTVISSDFIEKIMPVFENDKRKKIAAVVGKVSGRNKRWITTYRLWEYEINQTIHKAAQSYLGAITVCPGPSTVYRSKVFDKLKYSKDTQTEDMDFTFTLHRRRLGRIVYEPSATVSTQDPATVGAYVKQLNRWYCGFWQCIFKHRIPWGGQRLDAEAALLATDALLNVLLAILFIAIIPASLVFDPKVLITPILLDLFVFMLPTILFVSLKRKLFGIIVFLPHFYFLRFVGSYLFFYSFIKTSLGITTETSNVWDSARYKVVKEEVWVS